MTFILTDNFAKMVSESLGKAYKMLEDYVVKDSGLPLKIEEITYIAMVKTVADMIGECIANDKLIKKEPKKVNAIKSV